MSVMLHRRALIKKVSQVGSLTLLSRCLGIIRETLLIQYLDFGVVSDAFIASFKFPNFFRHIFAEGALSASFIPVFVRLMKEKKRDVANGLMTAGFLFFEGLVLLMYGVILLNTPLVVKLVAPGFNHEQITAAIPFMRLLFPFLLFISSSALLAGALHSVNHFFIPAVATPFWNMLVIATLVMALHYQLDPVWLCAGMTLAAMFHFGLHAAAYLRQGFVWGKLDEPSRKAFKDVLKTFFPCLLGASVVEINLLVSGQVGSYLPEGSVSLLYYSGRFMHIPLGIFAVALSTVMLPYFSRLVVYAPRRLSFYVLEVAKLVSWVIIPATMLLCFISHPLFEYLIGKKASAAQVSQGAMLLVLYSLGLLFLCVNKILLSMFYALKDTRSTTRASITCALVNIVGDIVGMLLIGSYGIAGANTLAAMLMTLQCVYFLHKRHAIIFYMHRYTQFLKKFMVQLACGTAVFLLFVHGGIFVLSRVPALAGVHVFFAHRLGFCLLSCAAWVVVMIGFFFTRSYFGIRSHFLES